MNQNSTTGLDDQKIKDRARAKACAILGGSGPYQLMPLNDQKEIYFSLVQDEIDKLKQVDKLKQNGKLARSMATDSGSDMGYQGYDPSFGKETKAFKELVDSVDFPQFVADLLKAVFNANLKVMKEQTDS